MPEGNHLRDGNACQRRLDRLIEACYQASCPRGADPCIRWTYDPSVIASLKTGPEGRRPYTYDDDAKRLCSFYYLYGTVGTAANLTDAFGAPQWRYAYEPFGALRIEVEQAAEALTILNAASRESSTTHTPALTTSARQYDQVVCREMGSSAPEN